MDKSDRRTAVRAWKERKTQPGVFAVRCAPSGQVWVAHSPNLDSQQNALWFALRTGGNPNRPLQDAWREHGEAAFSYEVLERIEDEALTPLGLADLLKARAVHWREALGAQRALG